MATSPGSPGSSGRTRWQPGGSRLSTYGGAAMPEPTVGQVASARRRRRRCPGRRTSIREVVRLQARPAFRPDAAAALETHGAAPVAAPGRRTGHPSSAARPGAGGAGPGVLVPFLACAGRVEMRTWASLNRQAGVAPLDGKARRADRRGPTPPGGGARRRIRRFLAGRPAGGRRWFAVAARRPYRFQPPPAGETNDQTMAGTPSKRSRFMTLLHAATKSRTNFSRASSEA